MKDAQGIIVFIIVMCFSFQPGAPRLWAQEEQEAPAQDGAVDGQPNDQGGDVQAWGKTADEAPQPGNEGRKSLTPAVPVMEIKRLESEESLYSIELRDVQLNDFFRVIAHDYDLNIIVDREVSGAITASFTSISLEEALDGIAELSNLTVQKKGNIFRVSPNLITKIFLLKYTEAKNILQAVSAPGAEGASAAGTSAASAAGTSAAPAAGTSAAPAAGTSSVPADTAAPAGRLGPSSTMVQSTIYDLLSAQGKIFLGEKPNSIIVIDYPTNMKKIEDYLNSVDQKMTSRIFKLKYLKSTDVVGQPVVPAGTASGSTTDLTTTTSSSGGG